MLSRSFCIALTLAFALGGGPARRCGRRQRKDESTTGSRIVIGHSDTGNPILMETPF